MFGYIYWFIYGVIGDLYCKGGMFEKVWFWLFYLVNKVGCLLNKFGVVQMNIDVFELDIDYSVKLIWKVKYEKKRWWVMVYLIDYDWYDKRERRFWEMEL